MAKSSIGKIDLAVEINIQPADSDVDVRSKGVLYGNIDRKYLIIGDVPEPEFAVGDNLIIRLILGTEVLGFKTSVMEVLRAREKLYLLDYPEKIESVNLRKAARLSVFFPADIEAKMARGSSSDVALVKAMVLNLGKGGCFFSSKRHIETPEDLNLSFALPGQTHIHRLDGKVVERATQAAFFAQRFRFSDSTENVAALAEIARWFDQNYDYALENGGD